METENNKPNGYYKLGLFYYEKNNKRLIVRSPNNRYTLNFANKWSYLIEGLFFVLIILKILATAGVIH
jgi:uncharacterized membrane protein